MGRMGGSQSGRRKMANRSQCKSGVGISMPFREGASGDGSIISQQEPQSLRKKWVWLEVMGVLTTPARRLLYIQTPEFLIS